MAGIMIGAGSAGKIMNTGGPNVQAMHMEALAPRPSIVWPAHGGATLSGPHSDALVCFCRIAATPGACR